MATQLEVWNRLLLENRVDKTRGLTHTSDCLFGKLPGKLSNIDYNGEKAGDYGLNSFWDSCVVGKRHFSGKEGITMESFKPNDYVVSIINPSGHETVLSLNTVVQLEAWRDPFTMAPLNDCVFITWLSVTKAESQRLNQPQSDRVLRSSLGTKVLEETCQPSRPSFCESRKG